MDEQLIRTISEENSSIYLCPKTEEIDVRRNNNMEVTNTDRPHFCEGRFDEESILPLEGTAASTMHTDVVTLYKNNLWRSSAFSYELELLENEYFPSSEIEIPEREITILYSAENRSSFSNKIWCWVKGCFCLNTSHSHR
ncbi:uncharacterized protein LOC130903576 [Diorhabda carinulata]|uniref:uncharacterized protein LOC130903576 n=1 Tax=Diorhabda carinulata TaxID=1163345 RepID=UPI0025A06567|nr:uncharacterized protein LOC130903576 [Diorhabda carinulata]